MRLQGLYEYHTHFVSKLIFHLVSQLPITTFKDNTWKISISSKMVSSSLDDSDKISVSNFDYMNIENPTGSLIELSCEEEKYVTETALLTK